MPVDVLPALAADVDALAAVPVIALPVASLMALVEQTAPLAARLDGVVSRAVGELQARGGGVVPDQDGAPLPLPAWLRDAAKVSGREAGRQVRTSQALRELPAVAAAVVDGTITAEHGRVLARLVGRLQPHVLLPSQGALLEVATRTDPEQLGHYVRHLIATWCEPELEADEKDPIDGRFLQLTHKDNGRVRGIFELPNADAEVLQTVLEPLARRDDGADTRTAGQRRADALTDVFALALRHGDLPNAGGSRPSLTYVVPAEAPSVLVDPDRLPSCPAGAWTGPATPATVAQLLCDARIDVLHVDAAHRVVSLSTGTGDITSAQRRAVATRDRCCTAKGCSRPPAFCDVHHLRARANGGSNDAANLVLLCRRHHSMWHRQQLTLLDLRVPWLRVPQPRAP
jgi:hypothetical protein